MDLAYKGIQYILSGKTSLVFLWFCILNVLFSATTSNAQDPAEKRMWLGWGQAYGNYEQDDLKSVDMQGITLELMTSHRSFQDGMVLGKALMDTRLEHHFTDDTGLHHSVTTRVIHGYYSIGFGKTIEVLKSAKHNLIEIGGSVELVGGFGILQFDKIERNKFGEEVHFGARFGTDFLVGYQLSIYADFDNAWTVGVKSAVYRNTLYIDYEEVEGRLNHIHSNMIFVGRKFGELDCVPTRYVFCR
jgi:hypothetical protein